MTSRVFRFKEFELDCGRYELRRKDRAIKLEKMPMELLILLATRNGDLVTRQEMAEHLWGSEVFVDSEHGINTAIRKLRQALRDDSDKPRFVATVTGKGYRFIAETLLHESPAAPSPLDHVQPSLDTAADSDDPPSPKSRTRLVAIACGLLVLSALTIAAWQYRHAYLSPLSRDSANQLPTSAPRVRTIPLTYFTGNIHHPVFSPDGKQIAFTWDGPEHKQQNIYTLPVGGNQPYQVTRSGPSALTLSWSPDGKFFAYIGCSDGQGGIYIVPAVGGPERQLRAAPCSDGTAIPQWTHDSKSLLISDPCGTSIPNTLAIAVLSVATGEMRCLTTPPRENYDMKFQLSPDGTRVAFIRAPTPRVGDYYVVPISGGVPLRLTTGEVSFDELMWSADSSRIIFSSGHPAKFGNRLVSVSAQGGAIAPELTYSVFGALSADGRRVVYTDSNLPADVSIWKVVFDSPGGRVLSHQKIIDTTRGDENPQLSPDGKRLAFSSFNSGTLEVWTSDTQGASPAKLTSFEGELNGSPHWSPDGKQIVIDRRPGTLPQLWLMDADGSNLRPFITHMEADVPSWSHDGRSIYFESGDQIWRQPLSTDQRSAAGVPVQLTHSGGSHVFESYDGKSVFFQGKEEGVWSIPSAGGPEKRVTDAPRSSLRGYWAVSEFGLYYLNCRTSPHCTFQFYNFKNRKVISLFQIATDPPCIECDPGFSASRDGRTLIYTLIRPSDNYIAMTELLP